MVEKIRLALKLNNGMVSRPSKHRLENASSIDERSERARSGSEAQEVSIACRVREVVGTVVLVHPRSLEEATVVIIAKDRLICLWVENGDLLNLVGELVHVAGESTHSGPLGVDALAADLLRSLPFCVERVVTRLVAL